MNNQSKFYTLFTGMIVSAAFLAGLLGCSGTYGRLVVNSDIKALFERNEVLPDHRYYYSGPVSEPRVIVGIHKDYTLQSDYWHPVDLTPELLEHWLRYQTYHLDYYLDDTGSVILDNDNNSG